MQWKLIPKNAGLPLGGQPVERLLGKGWGVTKLEGLYTTLLGAEDGELSGGQRLANNLNVENQLTSTVTSTLYMKSPG